MRRLLLLTTILVAVIAIGCAAPAPTPTTLSPTSAPTAAAKSGTLRFMYILNPDIRLLPMLMALDDLQSQGYTIKEISLASSPLIVDALARGDGDVGNFNNQTMWTAIAKGATARTVMEGTVSAPYLLVKAEIKSCQDLANRTIALSSQTGVDPTLYYTYMRDHCGGVKPQEVVIAEKAGRLAALLGGHVDGALVQFQETFQIEQQAPGKFTRLVDFGKEYPQVQVNGLQMSEEWAAKNPQLARDFIRAMLTENRRVTDNPQLLVDEGVKRLNLDPAVAKQLVDFALQSGGFEPNGGLTTQNIQSTLDFMRQVNALPASLKPGDVADLPLLNSVLDEIGRR